MVRIVNKLYPCYPAFSFKKADCRCQKCTEADCVFLSVIFRLINVADKVSISSSFTLYPSARWSVSWFPRLAESSYDDTLLKAEVLWLEIRRMPVTSFFLILNKKLETIVVQNGIKKCAGRIGLPFMTE